MAVRLDAYTRDIIGVATETILVIFMVSRYQEFMKGILTFIFTSIYNIVGLHTALNLFYSLYAYPNRIPLTPESGSPTGPEKMDHLLRQYGKYKISPRTELRTALASLSRIYDAGTLFHPTQFDSSTLHFHPTRNHNESPFLPYLSELSA